VIYSDSAQIKNMAQSMPIRRGGFKIGLGKLRLNIKGSIGMKL